MHNHKKYIGQTTRSLAIRIRGHAHEAAKKKTTVYFHNAIRKYGVRGFSWKTICHCMTRDALDRAEAFWITELDTIHIGYNRKEGGARGKLSEESRIKIGNAHRGRPSPLRGRRVSEETKRKVRYARQFQVFSEDTRRKMSLSRTGKRLGPCSASHKLHLREARLGSRATLGTRMKMSATRTGKHHSPETREKMRQAAMRRWENPESREIWETAIKTGNRWR
jgi:group I intron endonuclease